MDYTIITQVPTVTQKYPAIYKGTSIDWNIIATTEKSNKTYVKVNEIYEKRIRMM